MSRDLSFWRTKKELTINNCEIYAALSDGNYLIDIDEIPKSEILQTFNDVFRKWKNYNNKYYEKGDESFELMLTNQFVRVDCHGMTEYNMNRIIDILIKYNCPLYDSSIDVRFDGIN